jgi:hypothetical protein
MRNIVNGKATLPAALQYKPSAARNHSLYPGSTAIQRATTGSVPVFGKGVADRIYVEKWPGLITAFDELLKAPDRSQLESRITSLFSICHESGNTEKKLHGAIEAWAGEHKIANENIERLVLLASQIRQKQLRYTASKVKRTLEGATPNHVRWYPPRSKTVFIYYETGLDIPRNKNEGKAVGWGSMQQWREPASHQIAPKLIYTTASKPNYGLKAFVVDDEWYVKIHGGTSQQYHYTGLEYGGMSPRMDRLPNNLTNVGLEMLEAFTAQGLPPAAIQFYIAAVYNSELAIEFLEEEGSGTALGIKVLTNKRAKKSAIELVRSAQRMRDLWWLVYIAEGKEEIEAEKLDQKISADLLTQIGLGKAPAASRRFKSTDKYTVPAALRNIVQETAETIQEGIDKLVADLYA